jgi:hypothetical protein
MKPAKRERRRQVTPARYDQPESPNHNSLEQSNRLFGADTSAAAIKFANWCVN